MPPNDIDLITMQEMHRHLCTPQDKHGQDTLIEELITGVTLNFERKLGGVAFVQRAFTEDYSGGVNGKRGGARRIYLRRGPVVSVASITDDDSNTVAAGDYTVVMGKSNYLEHAWRWPAPVGRWTIVYTAGHFATTAAAEFDAKRACALDVNRHLKGRVPDLGTQSHSGRAGNRSQSFNRPTNPTGLPDDVFNLLAHYEIRWV